MHSPQEHLHSRRGRLHCGVHVSRKWGHPFHRDRWCVYLPLVDISRLTIGGTSEQIRNFWSAHNPNMSLKMFQTLPGSIVVPGFAGMTLSSQFPVMGSSQKDLVSQMPTAIYFNGALRSSSLLRALVLLMVIDNRMPSLCLICFCRGAPKDQIVPPCSPGCTARSHPLDHRHGLGSNQLAGWRIPHRSMCGHSALPSASPSFSRAFCKGRP